MKDYFIKFHITGDIEIEVRAENETEARQKAEHELCIGKYDFGPLDNEDWDEGTVIMEKEV